MAAQYVSTKPKFFQCERLVAGDGVRCL